MQIRKYQFPSTIELINIGDLHRGDDACDVDLFYRVVDYISNNPNVYWVSTGDILNTAIRSGRHSTVYNSLSLQKEYDFAINEFHPIAAKCLGVVSSNHHARVYNSVGISLDRLFCKELSVPYLGDMGIINVVAGKNSYYIAMFHGVGSGGTIGAKANGLERLSEIYPGADLYLTGHTHTFQSFIDEVPYIDRKRNKLKHFKSWFCTTGHFLDWDKSYAQQLCLKPRPKGAALCTLYSHPAGTVKKITIDLMS